jgi:hypothetical protein
MLSWWFNFYCKYKIPVYSESRNFITVPVPAPCSSVSLLPQRYICILLLFCEFDMCNMCIIHSEYESECRSTALLSGDAAITCTNVSHNWAMGNYCKGGGQIEEPRVWCPGIQQSRLAQEVTLFFNTYHCQSMSQPIKQSLSFLD